MITQKNITKQDFQIYLRNTQKLVRTIFFNIFLDMPVTFHKKIKSSGYGSQPNTLKFSTKQKAKV
jgi:hypothetical protein